jgi:hypothetical protein
LRLAQLAIVLVLVVVLVLDTHWLGVFEYEDDRELSDVARFSIEAQTNLR